MTDFHSRAVSAESAGRTLPSPPVLVGDSRVSQELRHEVLRAAAADGPILIWGPPGAGKSHAARMLHSLGPRADSPFRLVSCRALPATLLQAEVFGSAKYSVGGHACRRSGVLEAASGGSVVLEDVDRMSGPLQRALASVLRTGQLQPVAAIAAAPLQTRVIVTTRTTSPLSHLEPELVECLTASLRVPALRERYRDIPILTTYFAGRRSARQVRFSASAMAALTAYDWPGNVHQLSSVAERLVADAIRDEIEAGDLPVGIRPRSASFRSGERRPPAASEVLFAEIRVSGESFWSTAYPLFMSREITRADLRDLVRLARDAARRTGESAVTTLNMAAAERGKFERFLRRYGCALEE